LNNATIVSAGGSVFQAFDESYEFQFQNTLAMPNTGSGTYNNQPSAAAQSPVTGTTVGALFSAGGFPFRSYVYVMNAIWQQQFWLALPRISGQLPSVSALYWDASGENVIALLVSGNSQVIYTGVQLYQDYWQPITTPLLLANSDIVSPMGVFANSSQIFVDATYLSGIDRIAVLTMMPDELMILDPSTRQISSVAMLKLPVSPSFSTLYLTTFQGTYIAADSSGSVIAVAHINHLSVYSVLDKGNALELLYFDWLNLSPLTGPSPVSVAVGPQYVYTVGPQVLFICFLSFCVYVKDSPLVTYDLVDSSYEYRHSNGSSFLIEHYHPHLWWSLAIRWSTGFVVHVLA
jgi:hypothetical protein